MRPYFRYLSYMTGYTPMSCRHCMVSTHHPTCLKLSGVACGALRDCGEALLIGGKGGSDAGPRERCRA